MDDPVSPPANYARDADAQNMAVRVVYRRREAAALLGCSERTLERAAVTGDGPRFVVLGRRRIGYLISDLEDWAACRKVAPTTAAAQLRGKADR